MTTPSDSERGILHPREQARHRTLSRLAAGPEVGRFVEWYWIVEWDLDEPYTAEVLPFPSVNVTFEQPGGAFVNGVCTRKFERELVGRGRVGSGQLSDQCPRRRTAGRRWPLPRRARARAPGTGAVSGSVGTKARAARLPRGRWDRPD